MYDLYAYDDLSLNEITAKLNEMGLKPRKSEEWSVSTVKDILANPVYIGKIKWNARKEVKVYKHEKLVKTRPRNSDYILVDGLHKAIIDEKTWKIVSAKRSLNSAPVVHNNVVQNPLCGLVICAKCGKKMKRRSYSKFSKEPTLYCSNPNCDNIGSKFHFVEEKVLDGLKKWLEQYKFDYQEHLQKINHNKIESIEETILSLEAEAKKEMFKARSDAVSQNVARINNSIEEYKVKLAQEKIVDKEKEVLVPKIENLLDVYDLLQTPEEKNDLLKTVLTQVTYLKTEKSIRKDSDPTNFTINLYPKINKAV